jgi:type I restriction enzyme S subunit
MRRLKFYIVLVHSTTDEQLNIAWTRIEDSFSSLLTEHGGVAAFKQAILGLAYEGRLTRDWRETSSSTQDANDLIDAIQRIRDKELDESEGQREQELRRIKKKLARQKLEYPEESIPEGWMWASLLESLELMVDCHNKTALYTDEGIHLVRTTDIRDGAMNLSNTKKVAEDTYSFWSRRCPPEPGDIVFTREAPMGEAAIVPSGAKICLGQRTMLLRTFDNFIDREYLLYSLYGAKFKERMLKAAIGMTVKHLRVGDVENLVVPIAPIEEQREIVRRVDKLFGYCDRLTQHLANRANVQEKLASASVHSVVTKQPELKVTVHDSVTIGDKIEAGVWRKIPSVLIELVETMKKKVADTVLAKLLKEHGQSMEARDLWQKSGLTIDEFYATLKREITEGFIAEPEVARLKLVEVVD